MTSTSKLPKEIHAKHDSPMKKRSNVKVIVETSFMRLSGDHGTPMMSRVGRQTATEILEFHGEPMVKAESSFAQQRNEMA